MSSDQHAIGFIGYPAAGKSTSVDILNQHFDCSSLAIGDVVRAYLRDEWGTEPEGPEIRDWVTQQLEKNDEAVIRKVTSQLEQRDLSEPVLIDGIRTPADVRVLSEFFDRFTLVYIDVPDEVRLERIKDRGRDDEGSFTMEELKERDADEEEWGLGTLIEERQYDTRIEGYGEDYETRLISLVEDVVTNAE